MEVSLDANIKGLEKLSGELSESGKKILNVILTDFDDSSADDTIDEEHIVFKRLIAACARAGMHDTKTKQVQFYKTIADPQFMQVVKTTGCGLVGMYIVPVLSKIIMQAIEGDKTSQNWVLEITGMKPGKYDFYLNRYQLTHNTVNVGELNYEGKSDAELRDIIGQMTDVEEAIEDAEEVEVQA